MRNSEGCALVIRQETTPPPPQWNEGITNTNIWLAYALCQVSRGWNPTRVENAQSFAARIFPKYACTEYHSVDDLAAS